MAEKSPVIVFLFQVEKKFSLPGKKYLPVGEKRKTKSGKSIIENGGKSNLYLRFK